MLGLPKPQPVRCVANRMLHFNLLSQTKYIADTHEFFRERAIADPANLRNHKVFMFSGTQDFIVSPKVMDGERTATI